MDVRRRMLFKKASSEEGSTTKGSYAVNLNNEWEATTAVPNPDSTLYEGVYRSGARSYNVNNGVSIMYITITDCSSFKMYIRSYAESNWDYVMVSQLDKTINGTTSYSNTTLVKAHTRGNPQSGTSLSSYTLVEFTGIPSGMHTITVVYRKDGSAHYYDDRGYVLIEKIQSGSGDSGSGGDDEGGSSEGPINVDNYLTIEARENGLTASLSDNACEYCVDGDGNWKALSAGTATESINTGQTLSFRGKLTPSASDGIGKFNLNKKCNLKGNCMSMLFGDNAANNYSLSGKEYAFYRLFYGCANIVSVSDGFLPAITLARYCYAYMFNGCSSLTTAPALPATTLFSECYYNMFYGCTSLTTSPELPATTGAGNCYYNMFYGTNILPDCSNIDFTSNTVVNSGILQGLFAGTKVTDNDLYNILPINPATGKYWLPVTVLTKSSCYYYMFSNCTKLTTAPELPATTLASSCYRHMFYSCTSLTTAPALPAKQLADYCYDSMFSSCTKLTTAPELPATTLASSCYRQMFVFTSITIAPDLPATTLRTSCYQSMFSFCSKLNYIRMLATNISASNCLSSWVSGVASSGTFVKSPNMTTLSTGANGIPSGWTVQNATS